MESFNLGGIVFVLVLVLWVLYAVPRIAERRDVMGATAEVESAHDSRTARELPVAGRSPSSRREVTSPMTENRPLLRPADPTARPRFPAAESRTSDAEANSTRSRRVLRVLLAALAAGTLLSLLGAVLGPVPALVPIIGAVVLVALVIALRRAELSRRAALRRAHERHAEKTWSGRPMHTERRTPAPAPATGASAPAAETSAPGNDAATAEHPARTSDTASAPEATEAQPGEWIPRPVPVPRYVLHGEVEDLGDRHRAHNRSLRAASVPLERSDLEDVEADLETASPTSRGTAGATATARSEESRPGADFDLDGILARRRA